MTVLSDDSAVSEIIDRQNQVGVLEPFVPPRLNVLVGGLRPKFSAEILLDFSPPKPSAHVNGDKEDVVFDAELAVRHFLFVRVWNQSLKRD
ncbi:hypothetical protein DTO166G4_4865 [Paecilomyces variotii]|nr:hypothetical protein DTO164E3_8974 [Paecilomyces variotii]KAJ9191222.1 hypothetical protein DTO032I3_8943 [Paecilomyces variotii]KAJ9213615.1 hypothetical protein DTO166G4_4865 [Paecilomyces variotii]KAJ9218997.1 hypothetical protein DTO169C6_8685 [Paecilomyces variotii]KAJ9240452.1 hypothetical protein DTO166G5_1790 [Paecilomyces variotii]